MALTDANGNYTPLERHPDPPSGNNSPSAGQLLQYQGSTPTADGLLPSDLKSPAMAYKVGVAAPYKWDVANQVWAT